METAKNVFLWSGRDWLRKSFEAWFTTLIELALAGNLASSSDSQPGPLPYQRSNHGHSGGPKALLFAQVRRSHLRHTSAKTHLSHFSTFRLTPLGALSTMLR
jgi:hypothetical protein